MLAWKGPEPPPDAEFGWPCEAALASLTLLCSTVVRAEASRASGGLVRAPGRAGGGATGQEEGCGAGQLVWGPHARTRLAYCPGQVPSGLGLPLPDVEVGYNDPPRSSGYAALMVTARSGELGESWVTGRLLTDHLAVGGGWGALTTALPGLGLFLAPLLWLYWWCQPQSQNHCGHDPGGQALLNQAPSPGIEACVAVGRGCPSLVCTGVPLGRAAPCLQVVSVQVWELLCRVALGRPGGFSGPQSLHRWLGDGDASSLQAQVGPPSHRDSKAHVALCSGVHLGG